MQLTPLAEDLHKLRSIARLHLSGDAPAKAFGFSLRAGGASEAELEMTVSQGALMSSGHAMRELSR